MASYLKRMLDHARGRTPEVLDMSDPVHIRRWLEDHGHDPDTRMPRPNLIRRTVRTKSRPKTARQEPDTSALAKPGRIIDKD